MNAILNSPLIVFKGAKPLVVGETEILGDTMLVHVETEDKHIISFFNYERSTDDNESLVTVSELFSIAEETGSSFLLHGKPIRFECEVYEL